MKCKSCGSEILEEEPINLIINGVEYDTETTQLGFSFEDINIPKGKRLWTAEECIKLHNDKKLRKKLNLDDCWFWIKQPFELNRGSNTAAWFYASSNWADLDCGGRLPQYSVASLGVRFAKDVKKVRK